MTEGDGRTDGKHIGYLNDPGKGRDRHPIEMQ
jgi:hypothetical protein